MEQDLQASVKKPQAWSVKKARVLLHVVNCSSKRNRKLGSHPISEKRISHSNALIILSIFSCFQFHLLLSTRSFSLKLGPIIKLWVLCRCRHTLIHFPLPVRKHSAHKCLLCRTHFWSCNSFIAGYHLWLHPLKAFTGMSIYLPIWIQISSFFWMLLSPSPMLLHNTEPLRQPVEYSINKKASKSPYYIMPHLWPVGGRMECQLFNHPESKQRTQCNCVRMN